MDKNKCPILDFPKKSWIFYEISGKYNKLKKVLKEPTFGL